MGRYIAGEKVIVDFTFEAGDPDTVTARLLKPNGIEETLTVTPELGDGVFSTTYTIGPSDPTGDYFVKITGTGAVVGAALHRFHVSDDAFTPAT